MIKAIFLATTYQAACYWAQQWGFQRNEVHMITPDRPESMHGWGADIPVYLCGPIADARQNERMWHIIDHLEACEITIFDAQEMGGEYRPVVW
jgi:hypothetical protein